MHFLDWFNKMRKRISGATMVEYALIASLVAVAAILALRSTGKKVNNTFNIVGETFQPADAIYHDTPGGL